MVKCVQIPIRFEVIDALSVLRCRLEVKLLGLQVSNPTLSEFEMVRILSEHIRDGPRGKRVLLVERHR